MMKKRFAWNLILLLFFLLFFSCFVCQVYSYLSPPTYSLTKPENLYKDEFDPELIKLNSMSRLEDYCDSLFEANKSTRTYPGIVSQVLRQKFYHGYSYYSVANNPLAVILAPIVKEGADAVVMPNDIVKYPFAACSQQSIVGMEVLKRKGYKVRKVEMWDSVNKVGHFAFEAYYDSSWHYFDTNLEPDTEILRKFKRPSAEYLAKHPAIAWEAYRNSKDPAMLTRLLQSQQTGPVNKFPAPNAYLYQVVLKYTGLFGWMLMLLLILIRQRVVSIKRNNSLKRKNAEAEIAYPAFH